YIAALLAAPRPRAAAIPALSLHDALPILRRNVGEQPFDMARRVDKTALARTLRSRPAGIQPVGRGDGEKTDVAPVLGHHADRLRSEEHTSELQSRESIVCRLLSEEKKTLT